MAVEVAAVDAAAGVGKVVQADAGGDGAGGGVYWLKIRIGFFLKKTNFYWGNSTYIPRSQPDKDFFENIFLLNAP